MPTPSDAPNFDSLDADPTPASEATAKPTDSWRLGHHRPWWQWNVITLFVSLFVADLVPRIGRASVKPRPG